MMNIVHFCTYIHAASFESLFWCQLRGFITLDFLKSPQSDRYRVLGNVAKGMCSWYRTFLFEVGVGRSWDVVSGPKTSQDIPVWLAPNVQVCSVFLPVWSKAWLSIKCQDLTKDKRWRRITTVEMWAGVGVICKVFSFCCVPCLSAFLGIATLVETMLTAYRRFSELRFLRFS